MQKHWLSMPCMLNIAWKLILRLAMSTATTLALPNI